MCVGGCAAAVLLLFLIALIPYWREVHRCSRFTPTGDALFDKYARAVIGEQAPRLFIEAAKGPFPGTLPDKLLASWEKDYGADPRYWQLRYSVTRDPSPEAEAWAARTGMPARVYYLERAVELGHADAVTRWLRWQAYCEKWRNETPRPASPAVAPSKAVDHAQRALQAEAEFAKQHAADMRTMLDQIVAAAPDESWGYYRRARFHFALGEYKEALADLEAGNRVPVNRIWRAFPDSVIVDEASHGRIAANQELQGVRLFFTSIGSSDNLFAWRGMGERIAEMVDAGWDPDWLTAYHQCSCRRASMDGADWSQRLSSGALIARQARNYLVDRGNLLTREQRKTLLDLIGLGHSITAQALRHSGCQEELDEHWLGRVGAFYLALERLPGVLGPGDYHSNAGVLRADGERLSLDYEYDGSRLKKRLAEALRFDYKDMVWPSRKGAPARPNADDSGASS